MSSSKRWRRHCLLLLHYQKKKRNSKTVRLIVETPPPPPFIKGVEFSKFLQKRRSSGFSHKKGEVGKIGSILKAGVSLVFILTNSIQCYLFLSVWCVCVFCLFTPFLSIFFMFYRNNLILLHLINIYMTSKSE